VVIGAEAGEAYGALAPRHERLLPPVPGGATRQESVANGLEALAALKPDHVLIHDAARPFVSDVIIDAVIAALATHPAALPALPVTDTLKAVDAEGIVVGSPSREHLFAAQTPQGFHFERILAAHRRAAEAELQFTDDAGIASWAGMAVKIVAGDKSNMKLTTEEDFAVAEQSLLAGCDDVRVGTGYDVHAFEPGDHVTLGGVTIQHPLRLSGHSDADVALHALTDAVLGGLAEGDIGDHFPPSDPQWKGASSDRFLAFAAERVRIRGGTIAHLDLTIIAEEPKVGPHRDAMRARIAAIAGIDIGRVAVKATTNERLGFVGRKEGIAAIATATIRLPGEKR
jgi:2-C-methyl-D-erythritol 4-phosphate cytidylyltransferase/2-C-methyl-D-erythritol 2,4-cyclodiphosphate synthase